MSTRTTLIAAAALSVAILGVITLTSRPADGRPPEAADGEMVIFGDDPLTPVYIENPVDEFGVPMPVGPQHDVLESPLVEADSDEGPVPLRVGPSVILSDGREMFYSNPLAATSDDAE